MAEPTNPTGPETELGVTEQSATVLGAWVDKIKEFTASVSGATKATSTLIPGGGNAGPGILGEQTSRGAESVIKTMHNLTAAANESQHSVSQLFSMPNDTLTGFIETAKKGLLGLAGPLTALGVNVGFKSMLEGLDDATGVFTNLIRPMLSVEKAGFQMSEGMGDSFTSATTKVNGFRNNFAAAMLDTLSTQTDVTNAQKPFKDAFSMEEVSGKLNSLAKAQATVRAEVTLTSTALLVGAAKGMEAATVAAMLADAHLKLGDTVEQAALDMGTMAEATKNSGLGFETVSKSIVANADKLAMWGSSIRSVTPMLKAFSASLDETHKGLAPDLLNEYVEGLNKMEFSKRALVGLSTGMGGGGKGAIGAGLEMEALLEDKGKGPEGMEKISKNLIDTIKQFSGGQILTREQAIESPELNQNFLMQRELLKQMVGGSDASATRTLNALQRIDKNGLQAGGDAEAVLGEALKSGQDTQDQTTDALSKTIIQQSTTQIQVARQIADTLGSIEGLAQKWSRASKDTMEHMAKTGTAETKDIKKIGKMTGNEELTDDIVDAGVKALGTKPKGKREQIREREEIKVGIETGRDITSGVEDDFRESVRNGLLATKETSGLGRKEPAHLEKGRISTDMVKPFLDKAVKELVAQKEKIQAGRKEGEPVDLIDAGALKTINEQINKFEGLQKQKYLTSEQLGISAPTKGSKHDGKDPFAEAMSAGPYLPKEPERKSKRIETDSFNMPQAQPYSPSASESGTGKASKDLKLNVDLKLTSPDTMEINVSGGIAGELEQFKKTTSVKFRDLELKLSGG